MGDVVRPLHHDSTQRLPRRPLGPGSILAAGEGGLSAPWPNAVTRTVNFVRRHRLAGSGRQAFRDRQARELAERRQQVQRLVRAGLTSVEVAQRLGVSPATIGLDRRPLVGARPESRHRGGWPWTRFGLA